MVLLFASSRTKPFVSDGVTEDEREEGEIGKNVTSLPEEHSGLHFVNMC